MKILIVNDDGYEAEGIKILADTFKYYGEVYVVAPTIHQSGASASLTLDGGFTVHKHGNNVYSVEGTPVDCVRYAIYGLKLDIDLIASGVNNGLNIGMDTIYSGTVGAGLEALFHGYKAVAFSADRNYFQIVLQELKDVIDYIFTYDLLSRDYLLNVNFPGKRFPKTKGIVLTDLAIRPFGYDFNETENKVVAKRIFNPYKYIKKTDVWAYKCGYTSITPLRLYNSDKIVSNNLRKKIIGII